MANETTSENPTNSERSILHICSRETIRPLRDRVLALSGFQVDSTLSHNEGLSMFRSRPYDLVLIDVEGEEGIPAAENLCSEVKTAQPEQLVAFVCNWRVAIMTDCPDEILRTEFNPAAFAQGVRDIVSPTA
jgi:response regulator RpfG family c-di-GMP phosphodiesterase